MGRMFFFGYGYVASFLAKRLREEGWEMAGTTRTKDKVNTMWDQGVEPHVWDGEAPMESPMRIMKGVTHILHSIPPQREGDRVLFHHRKLLAAVAPQLSWYGYMSSISVYGDTQGEWADETYEPNPSLPRAKMRIRTEQNHTKVMKAKKLPLHLFRSGSIYGPGRNILRRAASGKSQMIRKEGHDISRVHIDDLANTLLASIKQPNPGSIYNVVDDLPCGSDETMAYAFDLVGRPKGPVRSFEEIKDDLPQGMKSLYAESRRVNNARIKTELGVTLKYPTYKEGFTALKKAASARMSNAAP